MSNPSIGSVSSSRPQPAATTAQSAAAQTRPQAQEESASKSTEAMKPEEESKADGALDVSA